jgi:exodeoxyribonuclease V alpha subunit
MTSPFFQTFLKISRDTHAPQVLSHLDIAFAEFLYSQITSTHASHQWIAALTSYQWMRGHACLDIDQLQSNPQSLLNWNLQQVDCIPTDIANHIADCPWAMGDHSPLVLQNSRVYLRRAFTAETNIRILIKQHLKSTHLLKPAGPAVLDQLFSQSDDSSSQQKAACRFAVQSPITLITGGPGTGKTTTVVKLIACLQANRTTPLRVVLAAPTGKASARLSQSIRQSIPHLPSTLTQHIPQQAQTLHRLLGRPNQQSQYLAADLIIVDEASMIDLEMMARLLRAVSPHTQLILLGDKDQLASIEAGAVMSQLCEGQLLRNHTQTLTHSHRFDETKGIGQWARTIQSMNQQALRQLWNQAPVGLTHPQEAVTQLTHATHHPDVLKEISYAWQDWLLLLRQVNQQENGCTDEQAAQLMHLFQQFCVLCALRKGYWGVETLNRTIEKYFQLGQTEWYCGRPMMVTQNDYNLHLMNGDIGMCLPQMINHQMVMRVAFLDECIGIRWVLPQRLDHVETVFAMTVHKSQGSEFDRVLLVMPDQDSPLLTRELIYTGLTRAKLGACIWANQPHIVFDACTKAVMRCGGLLN